MKRHPTISPKDLAALDFVLPPELEASAPPEARGLARDDVRLLVSYRDNDRIAHARFRDIGDFLSPGDLLVINTSGTRNAAVLARRTDSTLLELHLSTPLPDGTWSVELRQITREGTAPFLTAQPGEVFEMPEGASVRLLQPLSASAAGVRLWAATLHLPSNADIYQAQYGFPIRYGYIPEFWPSSYYQTVFANELGSAEMPSAGRAFTAEGITRLVAQGIQFAPLVLHTGVSSLEAHEPPYAEFYRVPAETAQAVNRAKADGRRIIAVGTTVVRALETVTDASGRTHPGAGWTEHIVTPRTGIRSVNGLLTGLHEPRATHLAMLEALADRAHLERAYAAALQERYLWHEFGDLHLILPR